MARIQPFSMTGIPWLLVVVQWSLVRNVIEDMNSCLGRRGGRSSYGCLFLPWLAVLVAAAPAGSPPPSLFPKQSNKSVQSEYKAQTRAAPKEKDETNWRGEPQSRVVARCHNM